MNELERKIVEAQIHALNEAAKIADRTVCDVHVPTGIRIYGRKAGDAIRELAVTYAQQETQHV